MEIPIHRHIFVIFIQKIVANIYVSSLWKKKDSDNTSSKIGADEIGNLFIQTLNSYVRGLSLKIDSFWQKKSCAKIPRKFSTHHAFEWTGQPARDMSRAFVGRGAGGRGAIAPPKHFEIYLISTRGAYSCSRGKMSRSRHLETFGDILETFWGHFRDI